MVYTKDKCFAHSDQIQKNEDVFMKLNYKRTFLVGLAFLSISAFWQLYDNLVPLILTETFGMGETLRGAIMAESTLSFMGIGLPLEIISWGSMLSLAEKALLGGAWWIILIPGAFLVATLMCITAIGNALRARMNRGQRKF